MHYDIFFILNIISLIVLSTGVAKGGTRGPSPPPPPVDRGVKKKEEEGRRNEKEEGIGLC